MKEVPLTHMANEIMSRNCPPATCPLASNVSRACQINNAVHIAEVSGRSGTAEGLLAMSPVGVGVLTWSVKVAGVILH